MPRKVRTRAALKPINLALVLLFTLLHRPVSSEKGQTNSEFVKGKICIGTNGRMSVPSNREHHYRNLRDRYTNCTYVDGNLELTWLQDENLDLSFVQYIREVTGHVLISHVDVKKIVLPNLQIIRGRTLFKLNVNPQEFALLVILSKMHTLEMPLLRDILAGSVGMYNNYNLCHMKTINWTEIITGPGSNFTYVYNFTNPERECPPCHESCEAGCWGEGPQNCQQFSKLNCSPQCYQGRCFGPKPRECCHLFCAGGCRGPKQSDCLACRNFYDDGVCTQECPAMQRYNPITYSWETNPLGKYAYGATCVKNCPEHLLKDNGACVRSCPPKKKAVNGECVPCDGPCPKTCEGSVNSSSPQGMVHAGNINSFKDCTIIEGSLIILDQSFKGFQQFYSDFSFGPHYPEMHPDKLEVFSTLKEVTGYINIQGSHPDFTNLSYFRNLEVIGGRTLTEYFASLYIVKTSLKSLGLRSLKKINSGTIAILENKDLCFSQGVDWSEIKRSAEHGTLLQNNKPEADCITEGLVCDPQCSSEGCWGPGPDQCLSCANYRLGTTCLQDCDLGMYKATNKVCMKCHEECASTCHGPGPGKCTRCKNTRDGPFCVPSCPDSKYNANGECKPCHTNCVYGCKGPNNTIGPGGCNSCDKAIINGDISVERCLQKNESCPEGYYYEYVGPQEQDALLKPLAGKAICRKCHPRCRKCTGYGFHEQVCQVCSNYKRGEQCEDECPKDHYADESSQRCVPCSMECRGCTGPTNAHCLRCRNYKIFTGEIKPDNTTSFNCTESCPPEASHRVFPENGEEPYCSVDPVGPHLGEEQTSAMYYMASGIIGSCILIVFLIALVYQCRLRIKEKNAAKMSMMLQGLEPLHPTNVKPNLAKLRIVKEAEMRRGCVLGYGAFGTVYRGVWVPEGENVKIPVAIKVLRERTGANTSKEFLDEAYIMASVEHQNLLQLLGVCMTSEMMLVTQLMPLGCLLDYVKNNKERIGSKPLLNWCHQIARGMAYLEEKRLVHRDLAARNVLVQTASCVKITDFGLAKLLDINEDEYKAEGGKMPIKWLAPECITMRTFTHKSDVWAFGVTIWELLTYGARPYENVPAREVLELLEKGERLPQPHICTIDVYMSMIKCWMKDPESRPSFKELTDEYAKMARDPGRYLVIPGDKLMRLPSYSSQECGHDDKDQTSAEGDEPDGEEYLQPKSRMGIVNPSPQPESPSQVQSSWDTLKFSQPLRYCSDPVALRDCELGIGDECAGIRREAHVGDLKLDLPLDEDDYLMPSPQQSQATTAYMDLIGDSKLPEHSDRNGMLSKYPDFIPAQSAVVDNPEYHFVVDQTLGIPHPAPVLPHQKSSEEESDHEYYNDFDRLKRELQPLRRNETTV
ncbi:epidermal growth factor receptor isoform X2 [Cimex lectularius]|uniref:Receptor protein-tyrosine kinase n=1 Tax=Cimex lectularius TaxID=79782 RepID=A0A8I6RTW5_CIMLE|nr:epidermal growth factor receptor isoform X2 [Cimex lectularius]